MNGRQLRKKRINKIARIVIAVAGVLLVSIIGYNVIKGITYQRIDDFVVLENCGEALNHEGLEVSTKHIYELTYWDIMNGTSVKENKLLTESGVESNVEAISDILNSYMSDFYMIESVDVNRSASFRVNEYLEILKKIALVETYSEYEVKDKELDLNDQKIHAGLIKETIGIEEKDIYSGENGVLYRPIMEFAYAEELRTSLLKQMPIFGISGVEEKTGEKVEKGINKSGMLTLSKYPLSKSIRKSMSSCMETSLRSFMALDKCYQVTYIPTQNRKQLVLLSAKLSKLNFEDDDSVRTYSKQLANIMDFIKNEQGYGNYVIASIDMNTGKDIVGGEKGQFGIEIKSAKVSSSNRTGERIFYDVNAFESAFSDSLVYEVNGDVEPDKTISDFIPEGFNVTCPRRDGDDKNDKVHAFLTTTNIEITGTKVVTTETDYSKELPVQIRFMLY